MEEQTRFSENGSPSSTMENFLTSLMPSHLQQSLHKESRDKIWPSRFTLGIMTPQIIVIQPSVQEKSHETYFIMARQQILPGKCQSVFMVRKG